MERGTGLMPKIALTNALIIVGLLIVACVALVTGNTETANTIVGVVMGAVLGAGATTVVVQAHMNRNTDDSTETPTGK